MITASIAVEGASDVAAVEKILASRSVGVDPQGIFVKRGKANLDKKVVGFNQAARRSPWFALRDLDQDGGDCPVALRDSLIARDLLSPGMCFRIAVRELEAWLLADAEAFSAKFSVAPAHVPTRVEELLDPKLSLINACRRSRSSVVRKAMVPPAGSAGVVGPEYVTFISDYAREAWRPEVAAGNAPSLARALTEIDRLLQDGIWS